MCVQKKGKNIFIVRLKRSGDDQEQATPLLCTNQHDTRWYFQCTERREDETIVNVRARARSSNYTFMWLCAGECLAIRDLWKHAKACMH